ncbi:beta-lactamase domain protein [Clostridium sp. CAG:715]|nr:beta-lactamase domain protein [Clostridium sp. CAG:715]
MPYDAMGIVFNAEREKTLYIAGDTIWCEEVKEALNKYSPDIAEQEKTLYIAGDTIWSKEVKEALNKYSPDIVVVNACAATVLNGERLIMNIDDLKEVLKNSKNATVCCSQCLRSNSIKW